MSAKQLPVKIIETNSGDIKIVLPAPRPLWFANVFLVVWLSGWTYGGIMFLFGQSPGSAIPNALLILPSWSFGWFMAMSSFLWGNFGKEVVSVSSYRMTLRREVFGVGFNRHFERCDIQCLLIPLKQEPSWWHWLVDGDANADRDRILTPFDNKGPIAFDYRSKTYRFGEGIEEPEADEVVARLNAVLEK